MLLRLQKYDLEVNYKKGSEMYVADTLSRAFLKTHTDKTNQDHIFTITRSYIEQELENINVVQGLPISNERLNQIKEETARDPNMQELMSVVKDGWPDSRSELSTSIEAYFNYRDEIVTQSGLILKCDRVIIPPKLRKEILEKLHSSHLGISGCLSRARECVFWPGLASELERYVSTCDVCRQMETTPVDEPLQPHDIPNRPWSKIGIDLFQINNSHFMVSVDYYSNFWEIDRIDSLNTITVIRKLKSHFARYGIPDIVISDNGPQFTSKEFQEFAASWEFKHTTTSPYHSRANGKAESAVKTAKRLIQKAKLSKQDIHLALLDHRNTPTQGFSTSPAQRLMSRITRTRIPILEHKLKPKVVKAYKEIKANQQRQSEYFNKHTKIRADFKVGDVVRVKPTRGKYWTKGEIIQQLGQRSYTVRTEKGHVIRRSSKFLKATKEQLVPLPPPELHATLPEQQEPAPPQQHEPPPEQQEEQPEQQPLVKTRSGRVVVPPRRYIEEY
jgi:transposase InsO family protein